MVNMKIFCYVSPVLITFAIVTGIAGCKKYDPQAATAKAESSYSSALSNIADKCVNGKAFKVKDGSTVSWRATKITPKGESVTMLGSNAATGTLRVKDSWAEAAASFEFSGKSTSSEDPLRDSRISSFIFNVPDAVPFGFRLTAIEGDDLNAKDFEQKSVTAVGTLFLANQSTTIRIPVLLKPYPGIVTVTPTEIFKLNVRSLSPTVNGINLVEQVERLLSFVPGVKLNNEVMIDFNLELVQTCS